MQVLDSRPSQSPSPLSPQLQDSLQDIVSQLRIDANFCIRHPAYRPLELPVETVQRFQQLPDELQSKYLSGQLCGFLYGIYYNGSLKVALAPDSEDRFPAHQDLENNTFLGVDLAFYDQLHSSNMGQGYYDSGWQVLREESDGSLAISKNGLTVHIDREQHLPSDLKESEVGDIVSILLPKNRIQNGFYMAVGNAGPSNHRDSSQKAEVVRIYFHLDIEGAVAVMHSLTQQLNEISLPFSFKTLYNPSSFGRYDSGVLYFDKQNYEVLRPVLQTLYLKHKLHFQPETPLFTKFLAPGLALAEEPDQKFSDKESFGTNRCQIVANGLLDAQQNDRNSASDRMAAIAQQFALLNINLHQAYLNSTSEDIYAPLDL